MAEIGDRVVVSSNKVGQPTREGVVVAQQGTMIRVRWSSGEESSFVPGPGSVRVLPGSGQGGRS
ncbi:MAG TPA: DUF1918 domain-containing protein [Acidimicrobiales bacterium]|jgi:hypothetical protein|nr:DUF1918 domain-containing protein [Acidimicrobiales bacterium]